MCFVVKSKEMKVRTHDVPCWKIGMLGNDNTFMSLYFEYSYGLHVIQPKEVLRIMYVEESNGLVGGLIGKGYHSYKRKEDAELEFEKGMISYFKKGKLDVSSHAMTLYTSFKSTCIKKFMIPAHTGFYENNTEYVSEIIERVE